MDVVADSALCQVGLFADPAQDGPSCFSLRAICSAMGSSRLRHGKAYIPFIYEFTYQNDLYELAHKMQIYAYAYRGSCIWAGLPGGYAPA